MVRRITPEVLDGFFTEVRGYLPRIRKSLDDSASQPSRPAELTEAYRLMHSIKGTASMIDLGQLSRIAGRAETALEDILSGVRPYDSNAREQLQGAVRKIAARLPSVTPEGAVQANENFAGGQPAYVASPPSEAAGHQAEVEAFAEAETIAEALVDSELAATVAEEFRGYLETIGEHLRALETDRAQSELISEIRRPLHTIKGTAGIVGMTEVSRMAHRMEDLLTDLDNQERDLEDSELRLLFQTADLLVDLVDSNPLTNGHSTRLQPIHKENATGLGSDHVASDPTAAETTAAFGDVHAEAQSPTPKIPTDASAPVESILRVRADRLDGILHLLGDVTLQRAGFDRQVAEMNELRSELEINLRRVGRMARRLTAELDSGRLTASATTQSSVEDTLAESEFDSLEMDSYTSLNLLSRQLEEAATDSAAVGSGFESLAREIEGFQTRLGLLTRDVQERLTQLRTVRFDTLSGRLHRTVRVTAGERNKLVSLVIEGGEVELDKNVLEEIAEPMLHLLRNAVDHGIESAKKRRAAGKPERGQIKIRVVYQGTEAIIQVQDDGSGIDLEGLRNQAARLGLLDPAEVATASLSALVPLIFQRGFSTASEVSEVSGRGIGLDVVNATITRLRGMLDVDADAGAGTRFTIRLPTNQSVLRVLLFASGGETLAVPLATIDRVESIATADFEHADGRRTVAITGESLRALELSEAVGMPPRKQDGSGRVPTIIVQVEDQRFALLADRILGVQEVVARPLSELFSRRLFGLGGAASTGDGRVVLVLNPNDLLREAPAETELPMPLPLRRKPEVLIVDDSLSVRQVLARLMERNGWQPLVARDGQDAVEILQQASQLPDAAIVDLEMPRMDGYELTRSLQSQAAYREIPIVVLTTRAGEKHRRKAFDLGASDYLIKPFQEKTLLETIRRATSVSLEKQV